MEQKLPTGERMSRAETLAMLESLKQAVAVGSLVGFGILVGLVASHTAGSAGATSPSTIQSQDQNSQPGSGRYFDHHRGNGFGFGSGGSSQGSFGHSRVS